MDMVVSRQRIASAFLIDDGAPPRLERLLVGESADSLARQLSSVPSVQVDGAIASPESATSRLPSGATVIFFGWLSPLAITWIWPTGAGWPVKGP